MKNSSNPALNDIIKPLIWGILSGIVTVAIAMLVCAFMFTVRDLPEHSAVPMGTACLSLGAAVAGFVSALVHRTRGMIVGALTGAVLFVLMLVLSVLVSGTEFTSATPLRLFLMIALSAVGGIVGVNIASRRRMI